MIRGGNIGAMDVELVVEQPTYSFDPVTNEQTVTWSTFTTLWGEKIKNPESDELFEGDQQVARTRSYFRVRWTEGLNEMMRVTRNGVAEYIKRIEEIDREKFLMLTTEKRDNA